MARVSPVRLLQRLRPIGLALAVAWIALLPGWSTFAERQDLYFFDVYLQNQGPGQATLRWTPGQQTPDAREVVTQQAVGAQPQPGRYRFWVAPNSPRELRLTVAPGTQVGAARLVRDDGALLQSWPSAPDADAGPSYTFKIADIVDLRPTWTAALRRLGPTWLLLAFGSLALAVGWLKLPTGLRSGLAQWAERQPGASLAVVAAMAVAIQAHPILFGGRSFVAPSNGALLLHDHTPTLPGDPAREMVDTMGSDVGAMMFQHVHFAQLQAEAIFDHGEWPWWNRSNLLGTPLLGQGQTMLGDPLHWPVILARGAAWAWDARFLTARFLAAWGLGLLVWLLHRNLRAACVISFAGAFLGYYLYRLNHPALFGFGYAPWILVCWLVGAHATTAQPRFLAWSGGIVTTLALQQSGTIKEATALLLVLHPVGLAWYWDATRGRPRGRDAVWLGLGVTLTALLAAPLVWPFVRTLASASTLSDQPALGVLPWRQALTVFDEGLGRGLTPEEWAAAPSLNGLFLAGSVLLLCVVKDWIRDRRAWPILAAAVVSATLAWGLLPASWYATLPFVRQVGHVGNTFNCPLLVLLALGAGSGLALTWPRDGRPRGSWNLLVLVGAMLVGWTAATLLPASRFIHGYTWQIIGASLAFAAAWMAMARGARVAGLAILFLAGGSLIWRLTQAEASRFNHYVFLPGTRVDLRPSLDVARLLGAQNHEPGRVIGLGRTLFPGYAAALGWESPYGVDPLHHPGYEQLARAAGLVRVSTWDTENSLADLKRYSGVYDMLNVRWVVTEPGTLPQPPPAWEWRGSAELDVFERTTAWPRAFATQQRLPAATPADLVRTLREHRLFVAPAPGAPTAPAGWPAIEHAGPPQPATQFTATPNTVRYRQKTLGPSCLVLLEPDWPGDVVATVNGRPATVFPVNQIGRGIWVEAAGDYDVKYLYRPLYIECTWWAGSIGLLAFLAVARWGRRGFAIER